MIRTAWLGDYQFTTSALGFGTAGLFHEPSKAARQRLLEAAVEAGILHFDVAPIYGLGLAEIELGEALRSHRENVIIATKVGIGLTQCAKVLGRVQGPMRSVLKNSPRMQERAREGAASPSEGRLGGLLYQSTFDTRAAQRSLEQSLRDLGTHIDLLLLHEPEPSKSDFEDLHTFLEGALKSGKIRGWGIACETDQVSPLAKILHQQIPVVQVRDDILRRQQVSQPLPSDYLITFGVLSNALPTILRHVNESDHRIREWNNAVGEDCSNPRVVSELLLKDALRANAHGTVLYSTSRPERLREAVEVFGDDPTGPDASLEPFRQLVSNQLGAGKNTTKQEP